MTTEELRSFLADAPDLELGLLASAEKREMPLLCWVEIDDLLLLWHRLNFDAVPFAVNADERLGEASVLVTGDGVLYVAHLGAVQAELISPLVVHSIQAMELLDGTLIEDGFGLSVLEKLVDGLGDEPNRGVVVAVMSEHCLEERRLAASCMM